MALHACALFLLTSGVDRHPGSLLFTLPRQEKADLTDGADDLRYPQRRLLVSLSAKQLGTGAQPPVERDGRGAAAVPRPCTARLHGGGGDGRSEEHTSELQSRPHLVCRLLLEKKK